jgi:fructose-specific PTS system IIC-like component
MIGAASGCVTAALLGAQCYAGWGGLIVLPVVQGKAGLLPRCWSAPASAPPASSC